MSVTAKTYFRNHITGLALAPSDVNNETVNGATILEPWTFGRSIAFQVILGTLADALVVTVEGLLRSDGTTWQTVQDFTGAADLGFALTNTDGSADGTGVLGELDLGAIDSDTYKAIRLSVVNDAAAICFIGATYSIYNLIRSNDSTVTVPDMFMEQRYSGGTP
jgi:hypothetical protein